MDFAIASLQFSTHKMDALNKLATKFFWSNNLLLKYTFRRPIIDLTLVSLNVLFQDSIIFYLYSSIARFLDSNLLNNDALYVLKNCHIIDFF